MDNLNEPLEKAGLPKTLNQKQTKSLKKNIVEDGALNIGYMPDVKAKMLELDSNILEKTMASAGGWVAESLAVQAHDISQNGEFDNILVTEMVRNLNYQDFKEIAPYFFQYSSMIAENGQVEILGSDVELSNAMLQQKIEGGILDNGIHFEIPKANLADLQEGYDIIAYNPMEQRSITIDLNEDQSKILISLATQFGERMGEPVFATEKQFENKVVANEKINELFAYNGIDKSLATGFASMEVIDRLEESGISFSKEELNQALKEPKQAAAVEQLIEKTQKDEKVTVKGPRR